MADLSSSSASRFQLLALVLFGGLVFAGGAISDILANYQSLEFLQAHWPQLYKFLMSEKTHVVLMVVGMGMFGVTIWKLFQRPPAKEESHSQSTVQAAAQQAPQPAPAIHLPPIHITQKQYASPRISQNQPTPPLRVPELQFPTQSNIKCLGTKLMRLDGDNDLEVLEEHQNGRIVGGVVCFRNQAVPGKKVASADNVTAHIVYKRADDREIMDVPAACWVNEGSDMVDLGLGQTKCAILYVVGPKKLSAVWKYRRTSYEFPVGDIVSTQVKEIPSDVVIIEVMIIKDDGSSLPPVRFDLKWVDGAPIVEMK
jgi:hypothetical protein